MSNPMSFYNALYYAIGGNNIPYTSVWIAGGDIWIH